MTLPANVRRAIYDSFPRPRQPARSGSATVEVVVRLDIDPSRIRDIGGRERQLRLTRSEAGALQPVQVTLFGAAGVRVCRLLVNRRRAELMSITSTCVLVFAFAKPSPKKERRLL